MRDLNIIKNKIQLVDLKALVVFLRINKYLRWIYKVAGIIIFIIVFNILSIWVQRAAINIKLRKEYVANYQADELLKAKIKIEKEIKLLNQKLGLKVPKSYFLVINSASNEFSLYKSEILIKKDKCSTGSYILLKNGDEQQWMFKTPKGEFRIQGKTTSPVWKKPDWAFIEEGIPVPSANHHSRFEYGVLGDYALNLGNGYLIHGTLYQRFLGLPVTHGCIRLNDENLELVYKSLSVGSKVFIY